MSLKRYPEDHMKTLAILTGISALLCGCATDKAETACNTESRAWNADIPADDPTAQVEQRACVLLNSGQAEDYDEALRMAAAERVLAAAIAGGEDKQPEGQAEMDQAIQNAARKGTTAR